MDADEAESDVLRKSRPLVLATIGIAFFLFMTLFLRQSLLFQGETAEELDLAIKLQQQLAAASVNAPLDTVPVAPATGSDSNSQAHHAECKRSR